MPRYWSRATAEDEASDGRKMSISCWRSSDISREDAHQAALNAARTALSRLLRGEPLNRYAYGDRPMREEVLQTVADAAGQPWLAITRNRYGALVLNAAQAAFIDLDFPPASGGGLWASLLAWMQGQPLPAGDAQRQAVIWQRLEQFVAENPDYGFRVYRTCAGVRALATHALFDATSLSTIAMLQQLGSDPLYVRLCQAQACFRARLTPKPWRCGSVPNVVSWPREDPRQESLFTKWETEYSSRQAEYATCRLLGTLGSPIVHPEIDQVIRLHDQMTRCQQDRALA
jgi:hypothetical protein